MRPRRRRIDTCQRSAVRTAARGAAPAATTTEMFPSLDSGSMTDLIRIQRQLRKFGLDDDPPLVETDRDGTRLVLDLPLQVRQRDEGGFNSCSSSTREASPWSGRRIAGLSSTRMAKSFQASATSIKSPRRDPKPVEGVDEVVPVGSASSGLCRLAPGSPRLPVLTLSRTPDGAPARVSQVPWPGGPFDMTGCETSSPAP